jgi:hypothetical protein
VKDHTDRTAGYVGGFDSNGDHVTYGDALNYFKSLTLSAWIRPSAFPNSTVNNPVIVEETGGDKGYVLAFDSSSYLEVSSLAPPAP